MGAVDGAGRERSTRRVWTIPKFPVEPVDPHGMGLGCCWVIPRLPLKEASIFFRPLREKKTLTGVHYRVDRRLETVYCGRRQPRLTREPGAARRVHGYLFDGPCRTVRSNFKMIPEVQVEGRAPLPRRTVMLRSRGCGDPPRGCLSLLLLDADGLPTNSWSLELRRVLANKPPN